MTRVSSALPEEISKSFFQRFAAEGATRSTTFPSKAFITDGAGSSHSALKESQSVVPEQKESAESKDIRGYWDTVLIPSSPCSGLQKLESEIEKKRKGSFKS